MDLAEPILQDCPAPNITECAGTAPVSCLEGDQSCATLNDQNPCEYTCVADCPVGTKSVLLEEGGNVYRKCIPMEEETIPFFRCAINPDGVAQFEMQGMYLYFEHIIAACSRQTPTLYA